MRKPGDITSFPQVYLDIAEKAWKQERIAPLTLASESMAISTRHSFNRFRKSLAASGHPHTAAAHDLMVTLNGCDVCFLARGLWSRAENTIEQALQPLVVPGIDTILPQDNAEQSIVDWLSTQRAPAIPSGERSMAEPVVPPASCQHEWDATGVFCLHCRMPKPE